MSRQVQIYCLINPIDEKVFYIGATICTLKARLNGHCKEPEYYLGNGVMRKRYELVDNIKSLGLRPLIKLLEIVDIGIAEQKEKEYYDTFCFLGFTLLQSRKQFQYSTHPKIFKEANP